MITPIQSKAFWHISPRESVLKTTPFDLTPHKENVWVQSQYSLVSIGTELLVARGQVPHSLQDDMKVPYMEGQFGFPIKYGYSMVGQVISNHPTLQNQSVHLLHPHQNKCWVNASDCFVIPQNICLKRATLASNLETALNAVWDAQVSIGDKVLVVGFGLIGSLVARLLTQITGVDCYISDICPNKQALAQTMGFQLWDNQQANFDAAFHTSSSGKGLQTCIESVGFEGKVIELSWYGTQSIDLKLGCSFHHQRKQIISSQVSNLPPNRRSRWDYKRRKITVFKLLENPIFDQHLTHTVPFDELPTMFEQIKNKIVQPLGLCVEY